MSSGRFAACFGGDVEIRFDRLLGREVFARNGRRVGRLEECRIHRDGDTWTVVEYQIGVAGLWERLGLGARLVLGLRSHGYRARWDQLAIGNDSRLQLTCDVSDLRPA